MVVMAVGMVMVVCDRRGGGLVKLLLVEVATAVVVDVWRW